MKSHLISSQSHLKEGLTYFALCGEEVPRAHWLFSVVDRGRMKNFMESFNPLTDCKHCWLGEIPNGIVYGAVDGEELERKALEVMGQYRLATLDAEEGEP